MCCLGWTALPLPATNPGPDPSFDSEFSLTAERSLAVRRPSPVVKVAETNSETAADPAGNERDGTTEIPELDRPDIAEQYLRVPEGFRVELFADDDLAHDIYCMTLDSQGRVVVSGAGYIRILLDTNGDGRADRARQFADGPATGAQGMYFDGTDLLCVGDGGLLRYRDRDGDGRADGPPELLFPIRTGGEHHAHAIRRGPEGCWYLLAGNDSGIGLQHAEGPASPVQRPEAGGLLRLSPDFDQVEVVADGFRNAYDFDFGPHGDPLVYDSDGERDISLPWYRPTRVFQMLPGSHAGWLSRSWKRPDYFFEMPPVVTEAGRGSPTGVVCYQHHRFPTSYHQGLFVADWTFGRIHFVPLRLGSPGSPFEGVYQPVEPQEFVMGKGQFGFAPTDLEIGPDGDLFISVGGRGTRGGVYRVHWIGDHPTSADAETHDAEPHDAEPHDAETSQPAVDETNQLARCLQAVQPRSSWGRAAWYPLAEQLGREGLLEGVIDSGREASQRCRAIELMTELHGGLDSRTLEQLHDAPPTVRARAAWSIGAATRSPVANETTNDGSQVRLMLQPFLRDQDPLVVCRAVESLMAHAHRLSPSELIELLRGPLEHDSPWVRQLGARVVSQHREPLRPELLERLETSSFQAQSSMLFGLVERPESVDEEVFWKAHALLADARTPDDWNLLLRAMQLAVGDQGPGHDGKPVFDGYASRLPLGDAAPSLRQTSARLVGGASCRW
jgi:putative membrane-bound dehydrogenase-like protein